MRKWQDLASKSDPNTWSDVSGMWGTGRGTYEVSDVLGDSTTISGATGETGTNSAWAFNTLSGTRAYVFGVSLIWELSSSGGAITDRTGALVTFPDYACQYGDITIGARGTGSSLVSSSGGNFAAIAGAPSAKIVVVQSNAVVAFNTSVSADGWHASDVGDYTNWSTGESASGRILEGNGAITAAVPYGNDIIVFKADAIFRMTYVGGVVKWQVQKVVQGIGCIGATSSARFGGNPAVATSKGIFFTGPSLEPTSTSAAHRYYLFDGASHPVYLNRLTTIRGGTPVYDPYREMVSIYCYRYDGSNCQTRIYTYSLNDDLWGYTGEYAGSTGVTQAFAPVRGDAGALSFFGTASAVSGLRPLYRGGTNIVAYRMVGTPATAATAGYVISHRYGHPAARTVFTRMTPILRKRTNRSGGTPLVSGIYTPYTELHGAAGSTTALTESTYRNRFDLTKSENFATFRVAFADMEAEIEDLYIESEQAGTD